MCIKGFVNRLSHDCHIDIDRNVSTACCRSSSGNTVDLLRRTICTAMVGNIFIIIMVYVLYLDSFSYQRRVRVLADFALVKVLKWRMGNLILAYNVAILST